MNPPPLHMADHLPPLLLADGWQLQATRSPELVHFTRLVAFPHLAGTVSPDGARAVQIHMTVNGRWLEVIDQFTGRARHSIDGREFRWHAPEALRRLYEWIRGQGGQIATPTEPVTLDTGERVEQHLIPGVAPVSATARALAIHTRQRAARRGHAAPPVGGLFDTAAHGQADMFG